MEQQKKSDTQLSKQEKQLVSSKQQKKDTKKPLKQFTKSSNQSKSKQSEENKSDSSNKQNVKLKVSNLKEKNNPKPTSFQSQSTAQQCNISKQKQYLSLNKQLQQSQPQQQEQQQQSLQLLEQRSPPELLEIDLSPFKQLIDIKLYNKLNEDKIYSTQKIYEILLFTNNNEEQSEASLNNDSMPINCIIQSEKNNVDKGLLWLSNFYAAENHQLLEKLNIRAVLTVAKDIDTQYKDFPFIRFHKRYEVIDEPEENIAQYFDDTYQCIEQNLKAGNVLIHCAAGVSRSASCTIAYIMRKYHKSFRDVHAYVKSKRNLFGGPNDGFVKQLEEFNQQLQQKNISKKKK